MKALKDNLEEDEIPPQYQFGESSLICLPSFPSITYNLTFLSILGRDYKDYYDGLATEKEYNEEEESSGTPEEGTDEEGTDDVDNEEEEEDEGDGDDNSDRHMSVKNAPVATTDAAESYEVPEDVANNG